MTTLPDPTTWEDWPDDVGCRTYAERVNEMNPHLQLVYGWTRPREGGQWGSHAWNTDKDGSIVDEYYRMHPNFSHLGDIEYLPPRDDEEEDAAYYGEPPRRNITSAFQGITTPISDLYTEIHSRGWTVTNVDTKDGAFYASAKNPHGESVEKTGNTPQTALAAVLMYVVRREFMRQGAWTQHWADQLEPIAKAYAEAPTFDHSAAGAWAELAGDCQARAEALGQQLKIEVVDDPEPYSSPQELWKDVEKNKHLSVSRANSDHPLWNTDQVVNYRIVHDVLGHAAAGGDFGWTGENLATAAHMPFLSPSAQAALFSEAIGQSAYRNYYKGYGPQKITFLNEFLNKAQEENNLPGHGGLPIDHSLSPGPMPAGRDVTAAIPLMVREWDNPPDEVHGPHHDEETGIENRPWILDEEEGVVHLGQPHTYHDELLSTMAEEIGAEPANWLRRNRYINGWDKGYAGRTNHDGLSKNPPVGQAIVNHLGQPDYQLTPPEKDSPSLFQSRTAGVERDPNDEYSTGIVPPAVNAVTSYGDPLDHMGLKEVAHRLDTGWANWKDHTGEPDFERMKVAITNAFRVALLSPKKALRWNAVHYQDLQHIPAGVSDPKIYYNALEQSRIDHNRKAGVPNPEIAHKAHYEALLDFYRYYQKMHPQLSPSEVKEEADREVMVMQAEIEEKLLTDSKDPDMDILEPKVYKELDKRLKMMVKDDKSKMLYSAVDNPYTAPDRYGAFMSRHLIAIAKVARYVDLLTEAALEDVKRHDGAGHHFRAVTLKLGIPFVGPKIISFVWLLLQPLTSQLATIDTHMCDLLGYKQDDVNNNRDYFRLERELQAGRDAAGYSHMPLGQFQWAMWDNKRNGPGVHQDHAALRPWDPQDHNTIDWQPLVKGIQQSKGEAYIPPEWWNITEPYRQNEVAKFNIDIAPFYPKKKIPWQNQSLPVHIASDWIDPPTVQEHEGTYYQGNHDQEHGDGNEITRPWLFDHDTNIVHVGPPGGYHTDMIGVPVTENWLGGNYTGGRIHGDQDDEWNPSTFKPETWEAYSGYDQFANHVGPALENYFGVTPREDLGQYWSSRPTWLQPQFNLRDVVKKWDSPMTGQVVDITPEGQVRVQWNASSPYQQAFTYEDGSALQKVENNGPQQLRLASSDELHLALEVPERIRKNVAQWVTELGLSDDELEDPADYHITVAYAEHGVNDAVVQRAATRFNLTGLKFDAIALTELGDANALVIEFECPGFDDYADDVNTWLEEQGVEVSRYPGGFTPHMTIAYLKDSEVPDTELPPISFRCGPMSFSTPRESKTWLSPSGERPISVPHESNTAKNRNQKSGALNEWLQKWNPAIPNGHGETNPDKWIQDVHELEREGHSPLIGISSVEL